MQDPDVDILTRQSRLFPKSAPIVAMLVIAQRDTVDDKWLRATYEIPDLFLRKNYQNVRVEIADKIVTRDAGCYPVNESHSRLCSGVVHSQSDSLSPIHFLQYLLIIFYSNPEMASNAPLISTPRVFSA